MAAVWYCMGPSHWPFVSNAVPLMLAVCVFQLNGCNCECGGQVWRVDVGMSRGVLNAGPQALVIEQDAGGGSQIHVLRSQSDELLANGEIRTGRSQGALGTPSHSKGRVKWKLFNFEWVSKTMVQVDKVEDGM